MEGFDYSPSCTHTEFAHSVFWSFVIRNFLAITVVDFVLKISNIKHRITDCWTAGLRFETDLLTLVFTLVDQEIIRLSHSGRYLKTTTIIILNLEIIINSRGEIHRATETFLVTSSSDEVGVGFPEITSMWNDGIHITANIE